MKRLHAIILLIVANLTLSGCTLFSCGDCGPGPNACPDPIYNEVKPRCCPKPHFWGNGCCDPSNYELN